MLAERARGAIDDREHRVEIEIRPGADVECTSRERCAPGRV
jgi:hypothetical protein